MTGLDKAPPVAFWTKPIILKLYKHTIGRVVIQQGNIDVLRPYPRSSERCLS